MADSETGIEFTVILYGIVASNALFRLSSDITLRTGMLLFAFLILATDWVEYQLSVESVSDSVDHYLLEFGLDITILVVWTFLTVLPASALPTYITVVAAVVGLQGLWDRLLTDKYHSGFLTQNNVELVALYGILSVLNTAVTISHRHLFLTTVLLFLLWKSLAWKELYQDAKQAESTPGI